MNRQRFTIPETLSTTWQLLKEKRNINEWILKINRGNLSDLSNVYISLIILTINLSTFILNDINLKENE